MSKKLPDFTFEHIPGNKYASLREAQVEALPLLAENLANITRGLMEQGILLKQDGRLVPNIEKIEQHNREQAKTKVRFLMRS